jgi:hypothetical protein
MRFLRLPVGEAGTIPIISSPIHSVHSVEMDDGGIRRARLWYFSQFYENF